MNVTYLKLEKALRLPAKAYFGIFISASFKSWKASFKLKRLSSKVLWFTWKPTRSSGMVNDYFLNC